MFKAKGARFDPQAARFCEQEQMNEHEYNFLFAIHKGVGPDRKTMVAIWYVLR